VVSHTGGKKKLRKGRGLFDQDMGQLKDVIHEGKIYQKLSEVKKKETPSMKRQLVAGSTTEVLGGTGKKRSKRRGLRFGGRRGSGDRFKNQVPQDLGSARKKGKK